MPHLSTAFAFVGSSGFASTTSSVASTTSSVASTIVSGFSSTASDIDFADFFGFIKECPELSKMLPSFVFDDKRIITIIKKHSISF